MIDPGLELGVVLFHSTSRHISYDVTQSPDL